MERIDLNIVLDDQSLQDDFKRFQLTAERNVLADFNLTVQKVLRMSLSPARLDTVKKIEKETKESLTKVFPCVHAWTDAYYTLMIINLQ